MCYIRQSRETGFLQVSYLANDVDASRTPSDEVCLLAVEVLELGEQALPSLCFDWERVLGVDVA